jgi:hypothetical protein
MVHLNVTSIGFCSIVARRHCQRVPPASIHPSHSSSTHTLSHSLSLSLIISLSLSRVPPAAGMITHPRSLPPLFCLYLSTGVSISSTMMAPRCRPTPVVEFRHYVYVLHVCAGMSPCIGMWNSVGPSSIVAPAALLRCSSFQQPFPPFPAFSHLKKVPFSNLFPISQIPLPSGHGPAGHVPSGRCRSTAARRTQTHTRQLYNRRGAAGHGPSGHGPLGRCRSTKRHRVAAHTAARAASQATPCASSLRHSRIRVTSARSSGASSAVRGCTCSRGQMWSKVVK